MANQQLIDQGLELMAAGMGTVFVFLTILVLATTLMSKIIAHFAPTPAEVPDKTHLPDAQTVAAISAAIATHRAVRKKD